jgi:hypothetical protein
LTDKSASEVPYSGQNHQNGILFLSLSQDKVFDDTRGTIKVVPHLNIFFRVVFKGDAEKKK